MANQGVWDNVNSTLPPPKRLVLLTHGKHVAHLQQQQHSTWWVTRCHGAIVACCYVCCTNPAAARCCVLLVSTQLLAGVQITWQSFRIDK
jgi:hypothetical protein